MVRIAVTAPGWETTIAAFRALPADIKRQANADARKLSEPLAQTLKASGTSQGSHAAAVAQRVRSSTSGGVPAVVASGLPYVLGSEWGGGTRTTTYYSTSRTGRRYLIVQRHTTRQFRPHNTDGYWWTPELKANGAGRAAVLRGWAAIVDEVIAGM